MLTHEETGFVIERYWNSTLEYWNGRSPDTACWDRRHEHAIRFSRFEDAAAVLSWLLNGDGRVVQHMWIAPPREQPNLHVDGTARPSERSGK